MHFQQGCPWLQGGTEAKILLGIEIGGGGGEAILTLPNRQPSRCARNTTLKIELHEKSGSCSLSTSGRQVWESSPSHLKTSFHSWSILSARIQRRFPALPSQTFSPTFSTWFSGCPTPLKSCTSFSRNPPFTSRTWKKSWTSKVNGWDAHS